MKLKIWQNHRKRRVPFKKWDKGQMITMETPVQKFQQQPTKLVKSWKDNDSFWARIRDVFGMGRAFASSEESIDEGGDSTAGAEPEKDTDKK